MTRRNVLGTLLYGVFLFVASQLFRNRYGAVFRVKYVDPNGSGQDYSGHLGAYVYNAERCCKNCQIIFAAFEPGGDVENGPGFYAPRELTPINREAKRLLAEVWAGMKEDDIRHATRPLAA
jgi:hypothetical protein